MWLSVCWLSDVGVVAAAVISICLLLANSCSYVVLSLSQLARFAVHRLSRNPHNQESGRRELGLNPPLCLGNMQPSEVQATRNEAMG